VGRIPHHRLRPSNLMQRGTPSRPQYRPLRSIPTSSTASPGTTWARARPGPESFKGAEDLTGTGRTPYQNLASSGVRLETVRSG
jgi:hypothetical protein